MRKVKTASGDYLAYFTPPTIVSNVFMRNGIYLLMFIGMVYIIYIYIYIYMCVCVCVCKCVCICVCVCVPRKKKKVIKQIGIFLCSYLFLFFSVSFDRRSSNFFRKFF